MNFTTDDFLNEFQKEATKNTPIIPPPKESDFEFTVFINNIGTRTRTRKLNSFRKSL